jgi:hypothetical protein
MECLKGCQYVPITSIMKYRHLPTYADRIMASERKFLLIVNFDGLDRKH